MSERTQKERYYDSLIWWCTVGCATTRFVTVDLNNSCCQNKYKESYGDFNCTNCPYDNREYVRLSKLNGGITNGNKENCK